jgi:hypothetical protein
MNTMPNIETSFIPEQGVTYQGARRSTVVTVFSVLVTILALGATAGVWWLERVEKTEVATLREKLSAAESQFDMAKIERLAQFDNQINLAREMFNKHSMPSVMLDYLARNTVASIKWKQLKFSRMQGGAEKAGDPGFPGATGDILELTGETVLGTGYGPLYKQLMHFRAQTDIVQQVELQSFRIDPRTSIVSIQMRLILRPSFATFATVRARMNPETTPIPAPSPVSAESSTPTTQPLIPSPNIPTPSVSKPLTPSQGTPSSPTVGENVTR